MLHFSSISYFFICRGHIREHLTFSKIYHILTLFGNFDAKFNQLKINIQLSISFLFSKIRQEPETTTVSLCSEV